MKAVTTKVLPTVVSISAVRQGGSGGAGFGLPFGEGSAKALGSGVIIDKRGYIVTNYHVIKSAKKLNITLYDEREFECTVVGSDPPTDLAVIKIDGDVPKNLPVATLANSDQIVPGQIAIAVGNAFGFSGALNKDIPGAPGFTPFIDSLISVSYTYRYSFANGRKSISAIPSVLASVPSLLNPYVLSPYSGNKLNSFANTLAKKDYYSAFFHGAPNNSMGFNAFTAHIGINNYFGKDEYGNDDDFDGYWGIWDEEFFQFFAKKMNTFKEPFFTALFSVSSHHPYGIPERYKGKFPKGKLELQRTIGYTDYALKQFFQTASKMPWFKNTIFVLTADHAATYSDLPEYKTPSGYFAVPIIIYEPSSQNWKGYNDTTIVQQIDIMPTILNYLNYDKNYISFGTDMTDTTKVHFSVSYLDGIYQVVMKDYLFQFNEDKLEKMYNIKTDKLQKNNITGQFPDIEIKALKHLQAFRQEYNNRMIENKTYVE